MTTTTTEPPRNRRSARRLLLLPVLMTVVSLAAHGVDPRDVYFDGKQDQPYFTKGDEGGSCMDAMGNRGPWCGGLGVSCLPTDQWGLRCVKCGGKGEPCCDKKNIPNHQGTAFRCFGSSDPDERYRMVCISEVCRNDSSFADRYCGSPGYPACRGYEGKLYCWGTSVVGPTGICMETGRYYQRCNQGEEPREPKLKCDSPGAVCTPDDWCVPVDKLVRPSHLPPLPPTPPPPPPPPAGGATAPLTDNVPYKKAFSERCERMRSAREERICTPVTSGCAQVAMGCTGYVLAGGLPDRTTASRSACGKSLLEKYLACVTECNDRMIGQKLDWGTVGPCGTRCNDIAVADTRTCDAGGTLATTGISPAAGLPASGTGYEPGPGPDAHGRNDVVGSWLWFNQKKVVLHGDGRATVDGETTQGAWGWLGGDKYVVEWSHGEFVDILSLAPGKSRLAGKNQFGVSVTADRMEPPGR